MTIDLKAPGALTLDSVRDLLASASDRTHTQLRVSKAGIAYISTAPVGNVGLDDVAFCLETWIQGNDYVGPRAASDDKWVAQVYNALRTNWPNPKALIIDTF